MTMAVMMHPISRVIAIATRLATKIEAPNCWSWTAPTNARMSPIRKLIRLTMPTARGPQSCTTRRRSEIRNRARRRARAPKASRLSPRKPSPSVTALAVAIALVPRRASHGGGAPVRPVCRSGTASAIAMSRRTHCSCRARLAVRFRGVYRSAVIRTKNAATTRADPTQGYDGESSAAPSFEPTAERTEVFVTVRAQQEGHPSTCRLSRIRAVDDLAAFRDQLMRIAQHLGRDPTRSRDSVRSRLDVELCPQVDDRHWVAGLHPSLELDRVDARFREMTLEAAPQRVLDCDVENQRHRGSDDQRHPETGIPSRDYRDGICVEIAEHDPGTGPEQSSRRGVQQERSWSQTDHAGKTGSEWVHAGQKLGHDEISGLMRGESFLGVPDE